MVVVLIKDDERGVCVCIDLRKYIRIKESFSSGEILLLSLNKTAPIFIVAITRVSSFMLVCVVRLFRVLCIKTHKTP